METSTPRQVSNYSLIGKMLLFKYINKVFWDLLYRVLNIPKVVPSIGKVSYLISTLLLRHCIENNQTVFNDYKTIDSDDFRKKYLIRWVVIVKIRSMVEMMTFDNAFYCIRVIRNYLHNRFVYKTHLMSTPKSIIQRGKWYDIDVVMQEALIEQLRKFVEDEVVHKGNGPFGYDLSIFNKTDREFYKELGYTTYSYLTKHWNTHSPFKFSVAMLLDSEQNRHFGLDDEDNKKNFIKMIRSIDTSRIVSENLAGMGIIAFLYVLFTKFADINGPSDYSGWGHRKLVKDIYFANNPHITQHASENYDLKEMINDIDVNFKFSDFNANVHNSSNIIQHFLLKLVAFRFYLWT